MERYQFIVLLGRVEVLREEILANTKEAAIEVASAALTGEAGRLNGLAGN